MILFYDYFLIREYLLIKQQEKAEDYTFKGDFCFFALSIPTGGGKTIAGLLCPKACQAK
jgi:replicative superfamily II helicase